MSRKSNLNILISAKDKASGKLESVGAGMRRLTAVAAAAGAAVAGFITQKAIGTAARFEESIARINAVAGGSPAELKKLEDAARKAGQETQFSATQAASALEALAKAGLDADSAIAALPATTQLAAAGGIDLGRAAEHVTAAMAGFGLEATESARIADVLAMGANSSKTSVDGLAQAMSYAAPTAQSVGLSLEATVAIVGKFADAGIDASRAGTALNSILSQFMNDGSSFRREMAAIGITTNDFESALKQLAASGDKGKKAIIAVGQEAGPALRALLNQGMPALDELKAKLQDAGGSAADTAAKMQDNLPGAMRSLGSVWESILITLGKPVLPAIKEQVLDLVGTLRGAVADGTVAEFGKVIAEAFKAGALWVRDFVKEAGGVQGLMTQLREFAVEAQAVFVKVGEYASVAGNSFKLAYGVMAGGVHTVLAAIKGLAAGSALAWNAMLSGIASVLDGMAKITPGSAGEKFTQWAQEVRSAAELAGDASAAYAESAKRSLDSATDAARTAQDGWGGLTDSASKAAVEMQQRVEPTLESTNNRLREQAQLHEKAGEAAEKAAQRTVGAAKREDAVLDAKLQKHQRVIGDFMVREAEKKAALDKNIKKWEGVVKAKLKAGSAGEKTAQKQVAATARENAALDAQKQKLQEVAAAAEGAGQKQVSASSQSTAAAQTTNAQIAQMRSEYRQLIADGQLQAAALKMEDIRRAQRGATEAATETKAAIEKTGTAAEQAADKVTAATRQMQSDFAKTAAEAQNIADRIQTINTSRFGAEPLNKDFADGVNERREEWLNSQRKVSDNSGVWSLEAKRAAGGKGDTATAEAALAAAKNNLELAQRNANAVSFDGWQSAHEMVRRAQRELDEAKTGSTDKAAFAGARSMGFGSSEGSVTGFGRYKNQRKHKPEQQQSAPAPSPAPAPAPAPTPSNPRVVEIVLGGNRQSVTMSSDADADRLLSVLEQLQGVAA